MAKIFGPGGETEFFEITELQKGFEKELKTGEKVAIAPGVREASFLREAPIRAELATLFEQYRDRALNPIDPYQPPVTRFACTAVIRPITFDLGYSFVDPFGASYSGDLLLDVTSSLNTSSGYFNVAEPNFSSNNTFGGGVYSFDLTPYTGSYSRSSPSAVEIIVPDYLVITGKFPNWNWDDDALPVFECNGISYTAGLGGGVSFSQGLFNCFNIPNGTDVPIFELRADLYVPKYGGPFLYGVSNCSYTLFNYRFTNFYP